MAKNYSLAEAVQIIVENEDAIQLTELGKRFPLLVSKVTRISAVAGEEFGDLMRFMPENLSANKINQCIRKALEEDEDTGEDFDDDVEDDTEEETPKTKPASKGKPASNKKKAEDDADEEADTDYDSWNNAKMYKLLGEMGKRKDCKEKYGDLSHDSMLKYLKKYGPSATGDDDVEEDEDAEDAVDYSEMKAPELYKLCKSRKIAAEQKKPAKYYITLLKKADAAAAQAEDDAEDDEEWDEEEDETPAPKAKPGKGNKTATKPAAKGKGKSKADDAEDDEDWDI